MNNFNDRIDTNSNIENNNHHNYAYVPRNIIHKRKLNIDHAKRSIPSDESITPEQKLKELQELKECCRDAFKCQVEAVMLDEIQNQGLKFHETYANGKCIKNQDVRTISQFKITLRQNYSILFFEKVFHILYGCFDMKPGWAKTLEDGYMESKKLRYSKDSSSNHSERDKGCFELMAWDTKSELVKSLQRVGKESHHGYYINLRLPVKENGNRVQRKFGVFYPEMIKNSNGQDVVISDLQANDWDSEGDIIQQSLSNKKTKPKSNAKDNDSLNNTLKYVRETESGKKSLTVCENNNENENENEYENENENEYENEYENENENENDDENFSSETEKESEQEDYDLGISDHLKTRDGDLLFRVENNWIKYSETLDLCGHQIMNEYMKKRKLVQVYGKTAKSTQKNYR